MMDAFESRSVKPMLIAEEAKPFDSKDFIYELKLDGMRCLAYLSKEGTDLRNKRGMMLSPIFPELKQIHHQTKGTVILDGELIVMSDGKPEFEKLQSRALTSDPFKVNLASKAYPATFVAFDILYRYGQELFYVPLMERKRMLNEAVHESAQLAVSRVIEEQGTRLYELAEGMNLEGIVAKKASSFYLQGKRSKDWMKIKYMQEEDFVAAGYIYREGSGINIILGNWDAGKLRCKGLVTLGVTWSKVRDIATISYCPFDPVPYGYEGATWFDGMPMCTVRYMKRTSKGGMRQPVFKGFMTGLLS